MSYLIDTDIVIYSLKDYGKTNERFELARSSPKSISVITYGELVYGARKSKNVEKNLSKVRRILELFPVHQITPAVMETFADVKTSLEAKGRVLDDMDIMIAATALAHNLVLVTNNEKHFRRIPGLEIENWSK